MDYPEDLRYSADHEWARAVDGRVRIGITDYAQDALGDVVYVEVPEVGAQVQASAKVSEVESTKSVSDIYAPVAGRVVAVNAAIIPQFGGSNLGVPAVKARALLAAVGAAGPVLPAAGDSEVDPVRP
jgi:glycine cleavage system H protein